jgi:hypothetical protein
MLRVSRFWVLWGLVLLLLPAGCDASATPLVPLTATPAATPMVLDTTLEPLVDASPVLLDPTPPGDAGTADAFDTTLPAWTVIFYSSADHPAWRYTYDALNQMEAAGASGQIQVVAAVDWAKGSDLTGALPSRYVIRGNNDPLLLTSEEAIGAEEINFGDPQVLADVITWAVTTYPANRYALILDGYGAGWRGCCLDQDPGNGEPSDYLSPGEIVAALQQVTDAGTLMRPLDTIAFSGSFKGQLDVWALLAPFAAAGVASAAPVPAAGWDYQTVLGALYANPWQDGRALAAALANDYVTYHRDLLGNEFVAMTAVDLTRMGEVSTSVETLGLLLAADPLVGGAAAADARRGAQPYGAVLAGISDPLTTVDLGHAMTLLAANSPSPDVTTAARAVELSLGQALLAQAAGDGLPWATGVGIYWPATAEGLDQAYPATTPLTNWATFLAAFTSQTPTMPAPLVGLLAGDETANRTTPILLHAEVFGRQLAGIELLTAQTDEAGIAELIQLDTLPLPLFATVDDPTDAYVWPDGRHVATLPWDATTGYLYDSAGAASAALLRAVDPSPAGGLLGVTGELARITSSDVLRVVLEFPQSNPVPAHVWHLVRSGAAPFVHEVPADPGDTFTAQLFRQTTPGDWAAAPGEPLAFDDVPTLYRSRRPLDSGAYSVALRATTLGAAANTATTAITVDRTRAVPGFQSHVATALGLAFLYPEGWTDPAVDGGIIHTDHPAGEATLQVRVVDPWLQDAPALLADALTTLGDVSVLSEDTVAIGGEAANLPGARLAYGYTDALGRVRTGILTAFVQDGRGFIVDLDGLQTAEAELLETANTIADTWRFLSPADSAAKWGLAILGGYDVRYPPGLGFEDVNGWYRFVGGDRFVAVRAQPATRTAGEALAALLAAAGEGVQDFEVTSSGPLWLGGALWQQGMFRYLNDAGRPIAGTILTRPDAETEIAVWGEWPEDEDPTRDEAVTLAVAASMIRHRDDAPGN